MIKPIKIFVADDHGIVRRGLQQLVAETADLRIVGEGTNGREVLVAAETAEWDVLVLDLSLPRVSGVEVLRRLRELRPSLPVVVLSMYPEDQYARRIVQLGAAAYVSKGAPPEELLTALRRAAAGVRSLTERTDSQAMQSAKEPAGHPHEALTAREYQVFMLVCEGRTPSEICAELDLSSGTVSTHTHRIKEKLGVRSLSEVVAYAHRVGLVD